MLKKYFTFSHFTLLVALSISAIAAYYSVIGLTAIFAGAVIPIIVMGSILEIAKITTTVWLHRYWKLASYAIKTYLTIAVVVLACLTSMGIFGLLSKAHTDQGVVSGDVQAQVSLLDEKIRTQRDNIEVARRALTQMDDQVNQRLTRGDSEAGAERAVQIRRQQARERTQLQQDIAAAQREIAKYNEQRAPIAAQLRKVEAEVGPIKYIAALIYGDNPDVTLLERAVRWVIILIVCVFDPLAIVLILAANNSIKWEREREPQIVPVEEIVQAPVEPEPEPDAEPEKIADTDLAQDDPVHGETPEWRERMDKVEGSTPWPFTVQEDLPLTVDSTTPISNLGYPNVDIVQTEPVTEVVETVVVPVPPVQEPVIPEPKNEIITEGVTEEADIYHPSEGYGRLDGKKISIDALRHMRPDLVLPESAPVNQILFSNTFPKRAKIADIHIRIDVVPHQVYKFNGNRWFQLDKTTNTSYLSNVNYLQYLISKLDTGEYDPEWLTEAEQDEISQYLKSTR